ncbi:MAG: fumarylacetoacetate hydrolase family protein [Cyclobacteriaceae bacterium]
MKLFRYKNNGVYRPGISIGDEYYDVGDHVKDYDRDFFDSDGIAGLADLVKANKLKKLDGDLVYGPPVYRPEKIICIGLNYRKHAEESGMAMPKEPVVFFKSPSSLSGPFEDIVIPKNSQKTDWEVELAVVIGKKVNYVSAEQAMDYVAGYCVHNDVSERAFQLERGGQWVKGKSADTFAPLGPFLVTKEDIADPHNLNLWLKVNGEMVQNGNTSDFIFDIPTVISHLSEFMSLMPGDIISTGTPEGVGFGFKPQRYLKHGDTVELGIEGLGSSKQNVKNY